MKRYFVAYLITLLLGLPFISFAQEACPMGALPSVQFKGRSITLSDNAKAILSFVADTLKNYPMCKLKVTGYNSENNKRTQQLSWDHVNAVIRYLVEKEGISESRLIFKYGEDGNSQNVDLIGTTEDGPQTAPAPFPNSQQH